MLEALRAQTLPAERWELLLLDNASREPVEKAWNLSWHPQARFVHEEKLGILHARARGNREARGKVLVYVDDDNVLAPDYLAGVEAIMRERPDLGAIGAGVIEGEFEVHPPESIAYYLGGLALGRQARDLWTNFGDFTDGVPVGAGMAFRREVAEEFARRMESQPLRKLLGRVGKELGGGGSEDVDLALCAHDIGLGTGRFIALRMVHLIPKERLTEDYMVQLYAGFERSKETIHLIRHGTLCAQSGTPVRQLRYLFTICARRGFERRIYIAREKARVEARRRLAKLVPSP